MNDLKLRYKHIQAKIRLLEAVGLSTLRAQTAEMSLCTEIRLRMPTCAEAELAGLNRQECVAVEQHTQYCRDCALEYLWLLKLTLMEERGQLPTGIFASETDLTFIANYRIL